MIGRIGNLFGLGQAMGGVASQNQLQGQTPPNLLGYGQQGSLGGAYANQALAGMQQNAQTTQFLPRFEENVPDDELVYEGKLQRYPDNMLAQPQAYPPRRFHHGLDCCQRMLML